jgi:hypothetical protein
MQRTTRKGRPMEAASDRPRDHESSDQIAPLPGRVVLALDQLTADERAQVERAVQAFARGAVAGTHLPDPDPYYLLRATPEILVIVRRDPGAAVRVEEIVRQETWHALAHAH